MWPDYIVNEFRGTTPPVFPDSEVWSGNGFIKDRDHRQQIMFMSGWFVRLRKPDGLKKHMTAEPVKICLCLGERAETLR